MANVELKFSTDLNAAKKEVAGFRKEYAEMVKAVEKPLRQVDALKKTQENAKAASAEFYAAKRSVEQLAKAMEAASGAPVKGLAAEMNKAERALARASTEFERQKAKVREQRAELRAAGVDTRNLAAEQRRLDAEMAKGMTAGRNDLAVRGIRERANALSEVTRQQRLANIEQAKSSLGVTQYRAAGAQIDRLRGQYELLRKSGSLTAKELEIAQRNLTQRINESRAALRGMAGEQQKIGGGRIGAGTVAAGVGAAYSSAQALRGYAQVTDTAKQMEAQLRLATSSQEEFNRVQEELFTIAQNTASPVDEVVKLYARLAPALDEVGRKGDATKVIDALSKALKINGATTGETASVLQQFSQAMGSGVLRGEEFNAIAEAAPPLLRAMAQGLGVPTGALRAMAAEGQLTAEVITDLTVQALPDLSKAAEKLPDTVGNALTRLRNDLVKAFGDGDSSGLVTAITKLRELLTDPATIQALNDLAAGMATLAGYTITAAREFTAFAKELAFAAANASGNIDELEKLKKVLAGVKAARDGGDFIGRPTATFFMDSKQLDDWVKELEGKIEALNAKIAGMTVEAYREMQKGAEQAAEQQKAAAEEQVAADEYRFRHFTKYVGDLKSKQGEALKNAEAYLNKQVALERKATQDLEKAKQAQLETQQRYTAALAGLSGGGTASYGAAQDLKVKASQALTSGDVEGAKQYAQAALKMLQDLADAGENTFGFQGFIRSLQGIEEAADQINVDEAKTALDELQKKGIDLKFLLDSLSKTTITVKLDDAALETARQQIIELSNLAGKPISIITTAAKPGSEAGSTGAAPLAPAITPQVDPAAVSAAQQQISSLAQTLQQQLIIPVTPVAGGAPKIYQDGNSFSQFPPSGFATGGWTGPGGKYKPAGIVHAGEHVQPQEVVREPGALSFLEMIRRNGFRATLAKMQSGMRGYAEGGLVSSSALTPRFPGMGDQLEHAATAGPNMPDLGRVEFDMGGGNSFSMYAERNQVSEIRTAAKKFGRTHR